MKAIASNEKGMVVTGTWVSEGHTVTFIILENNLIKVSESFQGGVWKIHGKTWSTSKEVSFIEAMEEQDRYVKWGYRRTT